MAKKKVRLRWASSSRKLALNKWLPLNAENTPSYMQPFYSFIPSVLHPFGPSSLRSFIPSSLHSFIPPFLHSFIPSLFHSFIPSCLHSFIFLFQNPPILIDFIALKVLPFEKSKQKAKIHPQYCFKGELVTPSSGNIAITFYSTIETHGKL